MCLIFGFGFFKVNCYYCVTIFQNATSLSPLFCQLLSPAFPSLLSLCFLLLALFAFSYARVVLVTRGITTHTGKWLLLVPGFSPKSEWSLMGFARQTLLGIRQSSGDIGRPVT